MKTEKFVYEGLPDCTVTTLASGLKVYLCERRDFSTTHVIFGTRFGSVDTRFKTDKGEYSVPAGTAHYLEHKLFESEEGDAFTQYAATGADANAYTSFDRTGYIFTCADKLYENLDILTGFVTNPYFTEQTVKKEQGIIGQEIKMYDDSPAWRIFGDMLSSMYSAHPVREDIAGTVESIAKITPEALYECYRAFYNPSNMAVCAAGNFETEKILKKLETTVPPREPVNVERIYPMESGGVPKNYISRSMAVAKTMFCFGIKEPAERKISLKDAICGDLLLYMIFGSASPFYRRTISSGLINDSFDFEYFYGDGYAVSYWQGESDDPKAVASEIVNELRRVSKEGIDEGLFESAKKMLYGDYLSRLNTSDGIASALFDCAVEDCGVYDELSILRSLAPDEISSRLKLLSPENAVLSVITPN